MNFLKKAITLVEVLISIFIFLLILVSVMNLFSSGIQGSQKSLTHQDNMQTANILMAQIEYDLLRATEIVYPEINDKQKEANWKTITNDGKEISFVYDTINKGIEGVHRNVTGYNIASPIDQFFAKDHVINLSFTHFVVNATQNNGMLNDKHSMWVELEIGEKNGKVATFTMNRLISVKKPF